MDRIEHNFSAPSYLVGAGLSGGVLYTDLVGILLSVLMMVLGIGGLAYFEPKSSLDSNLGGDQ